MNEIPPTVLAPEASAVRRYLDALDQGRVDELMACFSDEAVYVHPGSGPEPKRVTMRGAGELRRFFIARGRNPWTHRIDVCAFAHGQCLLHGSVISEVGEAVGNFMACAAIDTDGKIASYSAYVGWGAPALIAYFERTWQLPRRRRRAKKKSEMHIRTHQRRRCATHSVKSKTHWHR